MSTHITLCVPAEGSSGQTVFLKDGMVVLTVISLLLMFVNYLSKSSQIFSILVLFWFFISPLLFLL